MQITKRALYTYVSMIMLCLIAGCASTTATNPFVGTWDVVMKSPMGDMPSTIIVDEDLTANMVSGQMGTSVINNIVVEGNNVSFVTALDAMGQQIELKFAGAIDNANINGIFSSQFGDSEVTGIRKN